MSSVEDVAAALERERYVADRSLAVTLFLALRLGKPLFVEGEAGVGKTEIAKVMARVLGTNLIRLQCYEGLDAAATLYEWNYQKQILHIKLHESSGRSLTDEEREIFSEDFLLRRPFHLLRTGNDHSLHALGNPIALHHPRRAADIFQPRVGA